jgi:hypothetical protein
LNSETVTDSLGRTWQLGPPLGRGTWGQSRSVRDATGREAVLKVPLGASDGVDADACAITAREQVEFIQDHAFGLPGASGARVQSPRLEATVDLGQGRIGLLFPRYTTLEKRLESGLPLSEALAIAQRIASALAEAGRAHGNLKPSNVWFGERGEVLLADPCTPAVVARSASLRFAEGPGRAFLPPEAGTTRLGPSHDTWALCQLVWAALQPQRQPAAGGVDKLALAGAKDRAHAAFATEGSNPRFRGRVSERLGALLSRGLSPDREPSPPFRFESLRELGDRVAEVVALVRPRIVDVGRLLPPASARDAVFTDPKGQVGFSVTVGGTPGVSDADDLVCGLLLTDLDKTDDEGRPLRVPVDDADVDVAAHPSGRLRFQFTVAAVPPGRYRLRVAFAVKDGGDEPQVATTDFEVRPPPGYVPPPPAPVVTPSALPFPRAPRVAETSHDHGTEERLTDPGEIDIEPASDPGPRARPMPRSIPGRSPATAPDEEATPVGAIVRFPRPIAPPDDDLDEPPTVQVRRAPMVIGAVDDPAPTPRFQPLPAPSARVGRDDEVLDTEELLADTGDVPLPHVSTPANVVSLPPAAVPTPQRAPAPPPSPSHSIPPPALFEANPATEPDDVGAEGVPGGEDLPGYGARDTGWRGTVGAVLALLRRDRYLSIGVAVASCLVVVLLLTVLLKTC